MPAPPHHHARMLAVILSALHVLTLALGLGAIVARGPKARVRT
jgi:hypothetical protein